MSKFILLLALLPAHLISCKKHDTGTDVQPKHYVIYKNRIASTHTWQHTLHYWGAGFDTLYIYSDTTFALNLINDSTIAALDRTLYYTDSIHYLYAGGPGYLTDTVNYVLYADRYRLDHYPFYSLQINRYNDSVILSSDQKGLGTGTIEAFRTKIN